MSSRRLKKEIGRLLADQDFERSLAAIRKMPPRQAISPLFGYFCDPAETVKWHAVTAAGALVADLARTDTESARIVIRRFIWNLNDESGGIGWGCPEAMGESLARSETMADEYWRMQTSYIQPGGNYLEHPMLQRGAVWGVGRLAHSRPQLLDACGGLILPYMASDDAILRAVSVWAAMPLAAPELAPALEKLTQDPVLVNLYDGMAFHTVRVSDLAQKALNKIPDRQT
jgi:hypothetical protein